jgi:uncharacterized protein (UPF0276 family)
MPFGLGLRPHYYADIIDQKIPVDWFEIISENYMNSRGRPRTILEKLRRDYPFATHGVSLSVGSSDELNSDYLKTLKEFSSFLQPFVVSDHLCWGSVDHENLHDLLPLPYTSEVVDHVSAKIQKVQDILGRPFVIENVSSYVEARDSEMTEWEFIAAIVNRTGCKVLLDVNNIFVSSHNHGFDPYAFLNAIPQSAVAQMHIAGHTERGNYLFDTHNRPVRTEVWELFRSAVHKFPNAPVLLEWDDDYPPFSELLAELQRARDAAQDARSRWEAHRDL